MMNQMLRGGSCIYTVTIHMDVPTGLFALRDGLTVTSSFVLKVGTPILTDPINQPAHSSFISPLDRPPV